MVAEASNKNFVPSDLVCQRQSRFTMQSAREERGYTILGGIQELNIRCVILIPITFKKYYITIIILTSKHYKSATRIKKTNIPKYLNCTV